MIPWEGFASVRQEKFLIHKRILVIIHRGAQLLRSVPTEIYAMVPNVALTVSVRMDSPRFVIRTFVWKVEDVILLLGCANFHPNSVHRDKAATLRMVNVSVRPAKFFQYLAENARTTLHVIRMLNVPTDSFVMEASVVSAASVSWAFRSIVMMEILARTISLPKQRLNAYALILRFSVRWGRSVILL